MAPPFISTSMYQVSRQASAQEGDGKSHLFEMAEQVYVCDKL